MGAGKKFSGRGFLVFYYIQYFMPFAYQRLKEAQNPAYPLWRVFSIPQKRGKEIYFMELAREIEIEQQKNINLHRAWINSSYQFVEEDFLRCIDYRKHPNEFELFVAFRLLFSYDNMIAAKDKAGNRGKYDDFYSANSYEVHKRENLGYINTEKMIRYLLQAGYEHTNKYVYWANLIVKDVLSCEDKTIRVEKFLCVLNQMSENERGVESIRYIGIYQWTVIFRAFVFAGNSWGKQDNENNFIRLIDLYDDFIIDRKNDENMGYFAPIFINETLPVWEGLKTGASLSRFAEIVIRQKIYCNWNQYVNFYCYVKAALRALATNTYVAGLDIWMLDEVEKEAREGHWDFCIELTKEILDSVIRELNKSHQFLSSHQEKGYLPGEVKRIDVLIKLIEFFQKVMLHEVIGKEKIGSSVSTKIIDHVADAFKEADAIEDDEEFKQYINNPAHGLGIVNSIKLIDKHEKKAEMKDRVK